MGSPKPRGRDSTGLLSDEERRELRRIAGGSSTESLRKKLGTGRDTILSLMEGVPVQRSTVERIRQKMKELQR